MKYLWFNHIKNEAKRASTSKKQSTQFYKKIRQDLFNTPIEEQSYSDPIAGRYFASQYKSTPKNIAISKDDFEFIENLQIDLEKISFNNDFLNFPDELKHFKLGIPKGIFPDFFNGVEFSLYPKEQAQKLMNKVIYSRLPNSNLIPSFLYNEEIKDKSLILLNWENIDDNSLNQLSAHTEEIKEVIENGHTDTGIFDVFPNTDNPSEIEEKTSQRLLLFIIKLLMFYSYKAPSKKHLINRDTPKNEKGYLWDFGIEKTPKTAFLVSGFMRQLRDERFYQGEYSNWEIGTRYTFVAPHLRTRTAQHNGYDERR